MLSCVLHSFCSLSVDLFRKKRHEKSSNGTSSPDIIVYQIARPIDSQSPNSGNEPESVSVVASGSNPGNGEYAIIDVRRKKRGSQMTSEIMAKIHKDGSSSMRTDDYDTVMCENNELYETATIHNDYNEIIEKEQDEDYKELKQFELMMEKKGKTKPRNQTQGYENRFQNDLYMPSKNMI